MLKKTITYIDYNGNQRTEDFYFNLNKNEIAKMEMSVKGGLKGQIERIIQAQDTPALIEIFEDLIKRSFGVKTPDGRGFVKRASDLEEFMSTVAYSDLYMELATNEEAASAFINGIVPADLADQLAKQN